MVDAVSKIKLILIHLADAFDWYILHNIDGLLVNWFCDYQWYDKICDLHMKLCHKIVNSEWWGDRDLCNCFYCNGIKYRDIDE